MLLQPSSASGRMLGDFMPGRMEQIVGMDSLGAFINKDVAFARQIPDRDDAVDSLYNDIRSRLVSLMIKDMSYAQNVDYLIWVAHNLERLADRVSNICERIIYVYTGEMKELDGPRKYQPPEE